MLDGIDLDGVVWPIAYSPTLTMMRSMREGSDLVTVIREAVLREIQRAWGESTAAQCQLEVTLDAAPVGPLSATVHLRRPGSDQVHALFLNLLQAPPATRLEFVAQTTQRFLARITESPPAADAEAGP